MDKDLSAKTLTQFPDVFSDICNVNLFGGKEVIRPEQLEPLPTDSVYRNAEGRLREHRRDVRMRHKGSGADIAIFCLENQSGICRTMPVRDMGYLYSGYQEQIRQLRARDEAAGIRHYAEELGKDQKLTPVISLVLYYGTENWDGPVCLHELLDIPDEWREKLEPLIIDHPLHIISMASQNEETRKRYRSDFRHVVDYLAYVRQKDKRKLREYMRDKTRNVIHPQEYLDMMCAFTRDKRYGQIVCNLSEEEKKQEGGIPMCIMLDMLEEEGRCEGRREGRREGIQEGISVLVETCQEFGSSLVDTIRRVSEKFGLSNEEATEEVNRYWSH